MADVEVDDLRGLRSDLANGLNSVRGDIQALTIRIEDRYVTREVAKTIERRVYALENQYTWTVRTILGVVIMAVLAVVIVNPFDLT